LVNFAVVEVASDKGVPQVVARWGPQPTLCAAYGEDGIALARKNGRVSVVLEILGSLGFSISGQLFGIMCSFVMSIRDNLGFWIQDQFIGKICTLIISIWDEMWGLGIYDQLVGKTCILIMSIGIS